MKRRNRILLASCVILSLFFGLAVLTYALTVTAISLEQLTTDSDLIVHGRIVSSESQWEEQQIFTYTRVQLLETLKGEAGPEIAVKQMGGRVGDIGAEIPGSPELKSGDEVILFLRNWEGNYWIHSIVLGKFSVVRESEGPVVVSNLHNIGLLDPVTGLEITDPTAKINEYPLADFLGKIRSISHN